MFVVGQEVEVGEGEGIQFPPDEGPVVTEEMLALSGEHENHQGDQEQTPVDLGPPAEAWGGQTGGS